MVHESAAHGTRRVVKQDVCAAYSSCFQLADPSIPWQSLNSTSAWHLVSAVERYSWQTGTSAKLLQMRRQAQNRRPFITKASASLGAKPVLCEHGARSQNQHHGGSVRTNGRAFRTTCSTSEGSFPLSTRSLECFFGGPQAACHHACCGT